MALARCEQCENPKGRGGRSYVIPVKPVGHPQSGVVCGSKGCENSAYIWLTTDERDQYHQGRRIFEFPTQAVKVQVADPDGAED